MMQPRREDGMGDKNNNKPFVNPFSISNEFIERCKQNMYTEIGRHDYSVPGNAFTLSDVFSSNELVMLNDELEQQTWETVGLDGIKENYKEGDPIGSYRASCFNEEFADLIWGRINFIFSGVRTMSHNDYLDWDGHREWKAVGVNPLFRFIKYKQAGLLVPHYDAPFKYDEDGNKMTQQTMVLYLKNECEGGATRFISDPQDGMDLDKKDYSDWDRLATEDKITLKVNPVRGSALLFDHRVLHDSEPISSGEKIIMRTDIIYERV